jgi:hypothetical protein
MTLERHIEPDMSEAALRAAIDEHETLAEAALELAEAHLQRALELAKNAGGMPLR